MEKAWWEARLYGTVASRSGQAIDAVDDEFRSTPLSIAARRGRREVVRLLLDRGADPNSAVASQATPLSWAVKKGHFDICGAALSWNPVTRCPRCSLPRVVTKTAETDSCDLGPFLGADSESAPNIGCSPVSSGSGHRGLCGIAQCTEPASRQDGRRRPLAAPVPWAYNGSKAVFLVGCWPIVVLMHAGRTNALSPSAAPSLGSQDHALNVAVKRPRVSALP